MVSQENGQIALRIKCKDFLQVYLLFHNFSKLHWTKNKWQNTGGGQKFHSELWNNVLTFLSA